LGDRLAWAQGGYGWHPLSAPMAASRPPAKCSPGPQIAVGITPEKTRRPRLLAP